MLCIELFFKEARIIELECVRSLTHCLWNGHGNALKIHSKALLSRPLLHLSLNCSNEAILVLHVSTKVAQVILQIVNIHIDGKQGTRWHDSFNF